jgi:hypothetical protein
VIATLDANFLASGLIAVVGGTIASIVTVISPADFLIILGAP